MDLTVADAAAFVGHASSLAAVKAGIVAAVNAVVGVTDVAAGDVEATLTDPDADTTTVSVAATVKMANAANAATLQGSMPAATALTAAINAEITTANIGGVTAVASLTAVQLGAPEGT